eukprot:3614908-Rhodomonas_salina.2
MAPGSGSRCADLAPRRRIALASSEEELAVRRWSPPSKRSLSLTALRSAACNPTARSLPSVRPHSAAHFDARAACVRVPRVCMRLRRTPSPCGTGTLPRA